MEYHLQSIYQEALKFASVKHSEKGQKTVEKQWHKPGLLCQINGDPHLKFRYWLQKSEGCQAKGSPFIELTNSTIQNIKNRYPNGVEISLPSVTSIGLIKSLIDYDISCFH